jgi:hypothetical protein
VGVVQPDRAGMASGINSTFRQVGIATGVALLGSVLASHVRDAVADRLAGGPLAARAGEIGEAVADGRAGQAIAATPAPLRGLAANAAQGGFADGLNAILLIGACVALVAAVLTFVLIRHQDFVAAPSPAASSASTEGAVPVAAA